MRKVSSALFEELVSAAMDELPAGLASHMSNVQIVVEETPRHELDNSETLLGLYEGIPLTKRDSGYYGVLPDRITLFKANLERSAGSLEDLKEIVRKTVIHEIAHHFGIDDDRLDELGWG